MFDKKRLLVCAFIFYIICIGSLIPTVLYPKKLTVFTLLAPITSIAAAVMIILYVRLKKKAESNVKQEPAKTLELNQKKFDELTKGDYFEQLFNFAEQYGINALPDYLKTYYVLLELYDAMSETGFDEFFINSHECVSELLHCCRLFDNQSLTKICTAAMELNKKYIIDGNENLSEECTAALEKLNDKFDVLDEQVDLQSLLNNYFVSNYAEFDFNVKTTK